MSEDERKHDVAVRIMDRNFVVKCPTDKITELHKAAKFLDTKIKEIKSNNIKIVNKDDFFVIAALNVVSDLFSHKKEHHSYVNATNAEIMDIQEMIEGKLAEDT